MSTNSSSGWARPLRGIGGTQAFVVLVKIHINDWLTMLALVVVFAVLNIIEPFHRFIGKEMMDGLRYPMQNNTVPTWTVPIIAVFIPLCFIGGYYMKKKDIRDLHHALLGLLFSVLLTTVITDALKDAVGRPRPDFFWRCFPDGKDKYMVDTGEVICTGERPVIREGYKSFPSGHTSWCFAGLGYLSLYLGEKIRVFDHCGHPAKLAIVLLPILMATLVGISRVDDYWHHWDDVFAGAFLGQSLAIFVYFQLFPSVEDAKCIELYGFVAGDHQNPTLSLLDVHESSPLLEDWLSSCTESECGIGIETIT
ncbi:hypothetical protein O6H91_07G017900 [Diphasiastrum complanatum]|nr:hypothetical protein O6H91_07G017900 [Diphasiastrum complanatum]KAJ7548579.1 hypothetical protein O6H91_07G017900 [Diphasiastrum complanatum]